MYVARRIAYNILTSATGKIISTVIALISIGLITRYLGKTGFGDYAVILAFFSFFGALADLGFYSISTREISRSGADIGKIISNVFSLRVAVSFAVFLISPLIVLFFPYPPAVKVGIIIVAGAFIFSSSYQVLIGIFQKNLAMDKIALSELVGKIIQLGVIYWAVKTDAGLFWVVGALAVQMLITFFIIYFLAKKMVRFSFEFDFDYWKKFLKESFPLGISVFITFLYFKTDTILLSIMKGSGEVGIYNLAYKIIENLTFFPAMVAGLVLPILSKSIFSNRKEFEDVSNKTIKFFLVFIAPLLVGVVFLSGKIINLIGGAGFEESARVLQFLIFALAFIFFGNLFNNILIAGNLQKKLMYILGFCAAFNITANLFLIPAFSYYGAAATSVATELLVVALTGFLIIKKIKYRPRFAGIGGILIGTLAMTTVLWFSRELGFFTQVAASGAVYFLMLFIFKTITTKEITSILNRGVRVQ